MSEGKNIVLVATGYSRRELSELKDKVGRCVILSSIGDGPITGTMEKLLQDGYQVVSTETVEPRRDKNKLVVVEDLDRMILQEQLKALGIEIEVVVDPDAASSMVDGLLHLPSTQEEMKKILGQKKYSGDFAKDSWLLVEIIAQEFNNFCMLHKFKALRDTTIGKLRAALAQRPDSGGNPAPKQGDGPQHPEDPISIFAGIKDPTNSMLLELLTELKGIRAAVTPSLASASKELAEAISHSQMSVTQVVEALRNHSAKFEGTTPMESKAPGTVSGFIELLTASLLEENPEAVHPALSVARLGKEERIQLMKLLNPTFTVAVGGTGDFTHAPFTPAVVFETLLEGLKEDGPRDVHICGMNILTFEDRAALRYACERAIGKNRAKVAGGTKRVLLEGLLKALEDEKVFDSHVVIDGIGLLSDEDTAALVKLLGFGLTEKVEFIPHQTTTRDMLEGLINAVGNEGNNTIILDCLHRLNYSSRRHLLASLKVAVTKFEELEAKHKKLMLTGEADLPAKVTVNNVAFALSVFVNLWAQAANEKGIEIDQTALLQHLLAEEVKRRTVPEDNSGLSMAGNDISIVTANVVKGMDVGLIIGNHVVDCDKREDGSVKITTNLGNNISTSLVINKDGSIKLTDPGYLG